MRALQYDAYGGIDRLKLREVPAPAAPRGRHVQVRVVRAALNPKDALFRKGRFRLLSGKRFPKWCGLDFAGEVSASNSRRLRVGDRVFGALNEWTLARGTLAEYVVAGEDEVALLPGGVSFDELLERSDFISVHAPLQPATRGLMNAKAFAKMKKGAYLINTARGPLIDEAALVAALDAGQLGGAALDVVTTEPLAKDSPLIGRDNVILTPHTAFYSVEALEELQTKCATDVARVLSGEKAIYPISA